MKISKEERQDLWGIAKATMVSSIISIFLGTGAILRAFHYKFYGFLFSAVGGLATYWLALNFFEVKFK